MTVALTLEIDIRATRHTTIPLPLVLVSIGFLGSYYLVYRGGYDRVKARFG